MIHYNNDENLNHKEIQMCFVKIISAELFLIT